MATRGESVETALTLGQAELEVRGDVFTHDALAWALAASSKLAEAGLEIDRALSEGTRDGRLFFHAAVIAHKTGKQEDAQRWAKQAFVWAAAGLLPGVVANACASLMREWLKAHDTERIERRLRELEGEMADARRRRRG